MGRNVSEGGKTALKRGTQRFLLQESLKKFQKCMTGREREYEKLLAYFSGTPCRRWLITFYEPYVLWGCQRAHGADGFDPFLKKGEP